MTALSGTALSRAAARVLAVRAPFAALFAVPVALLAGISPEAYAQRATPAAPDSVVARVDGADIYASDVEEALHELPPEYASMSPEALFGAVIEQLIDRQLVVRQARRQNLQNDLEVQRMMRKLEARVLEQYFYRRAIERKVTDEAVRRRYERDRETLVREKQVRARHILVKTRDEAMEIIAEAQKGKDFADLARSRSIGPSKAQGGDLGFFTREQMVPEFSAVAFSLRKGEIARAPVQTRYGWHVIKVEDIQEGGPPRFEDARDELRAKMADEVVEAELKALRSAARIERLDGGPAPGGAGSGPGDAAPAAGGMPN